MPRMPIGTIILLIISLLIYFGVAQRMLDRLHLSDKAALIIIAALVIGGFINIPLPARPGLEASVNVGGGLIPLGLAVYLVITAGSRRERVRAMVATLLTGVAVFLAGRYLGAEPETMLLDPIYLYPLVGGGVAYLTGRSRRCAFIAATAGLLLVDWVTYLHLLTARLPGAVLIGGGGAFDAVITSGLLAVLLAEVVGESRERLQGGPSSRGRAQALLKHLRPPAGERREAKKGSDGDHEQP